MNKFQEKTIHTEHIYQGKVIQVQVDEVILPNGEYSKRELVNHPGAVAVIAITKDNKIVFVEQYRKPLERSLVEIPAGKIEEDEQPAVTAIRELEEETGYTTNELTLVTSFFTSPGFADELVHIYLTDQIEKLDVPIEGDDDEFIEVMELSLSEAQKYVEDKRIHDAKTNYAILYLQTLEMK
ncbi:MAG TPA: NUDIX hydrolase [Virgibacillus sp.]|nr:NUDIX hydrolase [Virgibacillus sp.]